MGHFMRRGTVLGNVVGLIEENFVTPALVKSTFTQGLRGGESRVR